MENSAERINTPKNLLKALASGTVLFWIGMLPILVQTGGRYLFECDYNLQIIPFWQHIHTMFRSGLPEMDWRSDLGMAAIPGYSFYSMFSPYVLLSLLFPAKALPYAMTLLNGLKFGVAAMSAHLYVSRYVKRADTAYICGLLYAFSGIQVNVMIFHFNDVISLFPLVLYCFDRLLYERRSAAFAFALALTGFTNYYFFFGICIFLLIYFIVKVACREVKLDKRLFAKLAVETACGVLMTAVVLLPSFELLRSIKRAGRSIFDVNPLAYEEPGTVLRMIMSFFLPPQQDCMESLFFDGKQLRFSSNTVFIPLFGMIGVLSELRANRKSWYSRLIGVCAVIAVVPLLNSVFSALNSQYYARWFYMPVLIMVMMTGRTLENFGDRDIKTELRVWFGGIGVFAVFALYIIATDFGEKRWLTPIYLYVLVYAAFCAVTVMVLKRKKDGILSMKHIKSITCVACAAMLLFSVVTMCSSLWWASTDEAKVTVFNDDIKVETGDDSGQFYRVISDTSGANMSNASINWGYSLVPLFHSCISGETTDLYQIWGQYRESNAMDLNNDYALYSFLSVKYDLFVNVPLTGGVEIEPKLLKMPREGFELENVCGHYVIYENKNYIPMGFAYDHYIREEDMPPVDIRDKENSSFGEEDSQRLQMITLKALRLSDEQIEKYGAGMTELSEELREDTSYETYVKDCEARRSMAAYEFSPDGKGFTSRIDAKRDELVLYTVPWSKGFTASIDGETVPIEKVYGGLCAVYVPQGDHTVRFDYTTPGLKEGAVVSAAAAVIMILYSAGCAVLGIRKSRREDQSNG